ncbi:MAG: sensor histidine kinase [Limisphaerales bacterium]
MIKPVKFLLVDDLEDNLLALEALLRRNGLELLRAHSGAEALELLLVHEVALAFIDVQMPEMDGFNLAELMRGTERTRLVPIIFVTAGMQDVQRRFRGYEVGAVDFLYKPINPHILQSKADVFFELARRRIQLLETTEALRAAEKELKQHAAKLEATVAERTAKLRDSVAELEHFSYTITHDMRAPLRSMQGFAELLDEQYGKQFDETGRDFLRRIVQAASRMDRLIIDSLNYSKAVRNEFIPENVAPGRLLRGIVDSYPQFQPPCAEIELAEQFPTVCANEAGLTQCFSNVLSNAVKFVEAGKKPRVKVWSEMKGDMVRFWFQDNGIGIPADQQERVFVMFQRLDKSYEGTGVGLALVRKVVQQMKGNVGFESAPGQGTKFWIDLRAAEPMRS